MPVTIGNKRLGPNGQHSLKHPRPRDVSYPWSQNGCVAMGACPERFTHYCGFLHLCQGVKRPPTAGGYMKPHFLAGTEGSLSITALLCGVEISNPMVLDAKNDLVLEGAFTKCFSTLFRCCGVVCWCCFVFRMIF